MKKANCNSNNRNPCDSGSPPRTSFKNKRRSKPRNKKENAAASVDAEMTANVKKKHKGGKKKTERGAIDDPVESLGGSGSSPTGSSKKKRKSKPRNLNVDNETNANGKKEHHKGRKTTARERRALDASIIADGESEDSDDLTQPGAIAVEGGGGPRRPANNRSSSEGRQEDGTNVAHHIEATVVEDGGVTREMREQIAAETRQQLIAEAGEAQVVVAERREKSESVSQYILRHKKIVCAISALLMITIIIVASVMIVLKGDSRATIPNSLGWCPSGNTTFSRSDNYTAESDDATSLQISGLENIDKITRVEVFRADYVWYNFDPVVSKIRVTYRLKDGQEISLTRGEHEEEYFKAPLVIPEGVYLTTVNVKESPDYNVIDLLELCLSDGSCVQWGGQRGGHEYVLHKENSVIKAFFGEMGCGGACWVKTLGCHYETCLDK